MDTAIAQRNHAKTALLEALKTSGGNTKDGIDKASDIDPQTGKRAFTMARSPQENLKVLYFSCLLPSISLKSKLKIVLSLSSLSDSS